MSSEKDKRALINERLDAFNALSTLEGKQMDDKALNEIKGMLEDGLSPEECMSKVLEDHLRRLNMKR